MLTRAIAGSILLSTVLLAACGRDVITGVGYEPLVGQWSAISYDDEPLPIIQQFQQNGVECRYETYTLDLAFTEAGRFTSDDNSLAICDDGDPVDVSESISGTYRVSGTVLYLREGGVEWGTPFEISSDTLFLFQDGGAVLKLLKL